MKLKGRVALITGASRGVGRSVALTLAREGCDVVLVAKTMEPDPRLPGTLKDVQAEVEKLGAKALAVQCDVRFEDQIQAACKAAKDAFGKVDILVNNAGALFLAPVIETPVKRMDLVFALNARAPLIFAQNLLPGMIERKWGHVVNMSPPITPESAPGKVAYMTSKFGMTLLTYGLAKEVHQHNIAAHSLWPRVVVESQATLHFGFGDRRDWYKPEVLADATLALVSREPSERTGRAWLDDEVLREEGVTDFSKYAVDPTRKPQLLIW